MFKFWEYDRRDWSETIALLALAVLLGCLIFAAVMMIATQDLWWCGCALIVATVNQLVTGILVKEDEDSEE